MSVTHYLRRLSQLVPLLAAAGCVLTGCTHLSYELNHAAHEIRELTGCDSWDYYHSSKTGAIVPKHGHVTSYIEPAFFGYSATCWHAWPEGWMGCPPGMVAYPDTSEIMLDKPPAPGPDQSILVPEPPQDVPVPPVDLGPGF